MSVPEKTAKNGEASASADTQKPVTAKTASKSADKKEAASQPAAKQNDQVKPASQPAAKQNDQVKSASNAGAKSKSGDASGATDDKGPYVLVSSIKPRRRCGMRFNEIPQRLYLKDVSDDMKRKIENDPFLKVRAGT